MRTNIVRLPCQDLSAGFPALAVVLQETADTPEARYLLAAGGGRVLPAGKPLVVLIRSEPLSTPDQFQVAEALRMDRTFRVALERRRFVGALFANVVTVALVEVELGSLNEGLYHMVVVETALEFEDVQHPEKAANPTTSEQTLKFEVR